MDEKNLFDDFEELADSIPDSVLENTKENGGENQGENADESGFYLEEDAPEEISDEASAYLAAATVTGHSSRETVMESNTIDRNSRAKKSKTNAVLAVLICLCVLVAGSSLVYLFRDTLFGSSTQTEDDDTTVITLESYAFASVFGDTLTSLVDEYTDYPEGIQEKFKAAYAQNSDFVGRLTVPGTGIDFNVYQGSSNSTYLRYDNYGVYVNHGTVFLDYQSDGDLGTRNTVIYAHNYDNDLWFDELHNYMDLEFYQENPVIYYSSLYADYAFKVIAVFVTNGSSEGDNGYLFYYPATDMTDDNFMDYYDEILQRSFIITTVDVEPTDKIITLSTCTYYFDVNGTTENARLAVIARLVRDGESEDVDVENAYYNTEVRMPQLYYDIFGGTNPYTNASKWYAIA